MRLLNKRRMYGNRPFAGEGTSVYVATGATDPGQDAIRYRNHRLDFFPSLGTVRTEKANRFSSVTAPTESIALNLSAYVGLAVRIQCRPYLDDVELETPSRSKVIILDGSGNDTTGVKGTLTLLDVELREGGDVRIKTVYTPSLSGVQPATFTAARTAGPTTPTSVAVDYDADSVYYDFDFDALSAGTYTFKIFATASATNYDLLTGITAVPDLSGPPAPTGSIVAA